MSDAEQQIADGYYRLDDGESTFIGYVHHGVIGDDPIEWYLDEGGPYGEHTIERVYVLTQAEYEALQRTLPDAQGEWEDVPTGVYEFSGCTDPDDCDVWTVWTITGRNVHIEDVCNDWVDVDLPDNWRLQRKKAGA